MDDQAFGVRSQIGRFGIVPMWILQQRLSGSELAVYVALRCYADRDTGRAFPSRRAMAEEIGVTVDTVKRALSELRRRDLIRSEQWHRRDGSIGGCNYWVRDLPPGGGETAPTGGDHPAPEVGTRPPPQEQTSEQTIEQSADASASVVADGPEPDESEEAVNDDQDAMIEISEIDPTAEKRMAERDRQREYNKQTQELTKEYTSRVPMSKFPQVMTIVKRARGSGYDDGRIRMALAQLASEGRTVTVDSLRIAMDGLPKPPPPPRQCPCCTGSTSGSRLDLCSPCADADFRREPCDHGRAG